MVAPFVEFFQRNGTWAILILSFIGLYRLSDITMGIMANPFYLDLGFSKTDIANVGKLYGFVMTLVGSFLGAAGGALRYFSATLCRCGYGGTDQPFVCEARAGGC